MYTIARIEFNCNKHSCLKNNWQPIRSSPLPESDELLSCRSDIQCVVLQHSWADAWWDFSVRWDFYWSSIYCILFKVTTREISLHFFHLGSVQIIHLSIYLSNIQRDSQWNVTVSKYCTVSNKIFCKPRSRHVFWTKAPTRIWLKAPNLMPDLKRVQVPKALQTLVEILQMRVRMSGALDARACYHSSAHSAGQRWLLLIATIW